MAPFKLWTVLPIAAVLSHGLRKISASPYLVCMAHGILLVNQKNCNINTLSVSQSAIEAAIKDRLSESLSLNNVSAAVHQTRPKVNFFTRTAPAVHHCKVSISLAQPATGSWPVANPRSRRSQRPTQSCLVSALRSPVGVRRTRGGGGLARRVCGAKSAPHLGENVVRLLWKAVGGRGSKSQVRGPPCSSLPARLRAAKPIPKRPKLYRIFLTP